MLFIASRSYAVVKSVYVQDSDRPIKVVVTSLQRKNNPKLTNRPDTTHPNMPDITSDINNTRRCRWPAELLSEGSEAAQNIALWAAGRCCYYVPLYGKSRTFHKENMAPNVLLVPFLDLRLVHRGCLKKPAVWAVIVIPIMSLDNYRLLPNFVKDR